MSIGQEASAEYARAFSYIRSIATTAKSVVDSFQEVVRYLLVPELKAVKVSIDSLHNEMSYLRGEMRLRDEEMMHIILLGDEKSQQAVLNLSNKLDFAIDIRERLASLEARTPRQ